MAARVHLSERIASHHPARRRDPRRRPARRCAREDRSRARRRPDRECRRRPCGAATAAAGRETPGHGARLSGRPSRRRRRSLFGGAMIAPARVAAYEILSAVSSGNADLPAAIAFTRGGLRDERDRALASEIATGVQRWRASLDWLIVAFSKRPIERLDSEIVEILRLSAYQLLHLTRVPASAVVDDAVNLARRAGKQSATGFVNAILRTISRKRNTLPLPPRPTDPTDRDAVLDYFSVTLSHPRWLATRWFDRLGFEAAETWMRFNNSPAPVTLRANRFRIDPGTLAARLSNDGVRTSPTRYAPDGLVV